MIGHLAELAASLCLGAGLALVLAALGNRLRRLARLPAPPSLALPADFTLGGAALAVVLVVAGLVGAFRPAVILSVTVVAALCGRWRRPGWRRPEAALLAPAALLLPLALAPPHLFYDSYVYHLGLPWQALIDGRLAPHPESLFAAFPPLAQMLYAVPLAASLPRACGILHLCAFAAAATAVGALARRLGAPPGLAALAAATLLVLPALALVPALAAGEGFALAAAVTAVAWALAARPAIARGAGAGLLAGAAVAARLQGLPWAAIAALMVAAPLTARRRSLRALPAFLLGAGLASAAWWLKNGALLGQPLAPLGWRREGMDTLWRDAQAFAYLGVGAGPAARLVLATLARHLYYLAPLALAALLAVSRGERRPERLAVAVAALLGLAAWGATGSLPRFLAPSLALILALAAAAASGPRAARPAAALALAWAALLGGALSVGELGRWGGPRALLGAGAGDAPHPLVHNDPRPAFAAARALPREARVLFVGEPRGYGFPRPFVAPSQHDVSPLRALLERAPDPAAARADLARLGYSHLLINGAELRRLMPSYPVAPWRDERGRAAFRGLLDSLAPPVAGAGDVFVFAVGVGAAAPPPP